MDVLLTNGRPRVTAIQRFDHSVILLGPNGKSKPFDDLNSLLIFVKAKGYDIVVSHLHPARAEGGMEEKPEWERRF